MRRLAASATLIFLLASPALAETPAQPTANDVARLAADT